MTALRTDPAPARAGPAGGGGSRRRAWVLAVLAAGAVAAFAAALCLGSVPVPLGRTLRVLAGAGADPRTEVIVTTVRLPRATTAAVAGAALGVAGLQMQALFRNALADPYVLGVSSGASLGVALVVAGAGTPAASGFAAGLAGAGRVGMVAAATLGAAAVLAVVLVLARWVRQAVTLLIVGVMVGYGMTAMVSVLLVYTEPQRAQQFVSWGLGSFAGTTWPDLRVFVPAAGIGLLAGLASAKALNALLLGEDYARSMGLRVRRVRIVSLLGASLLAGTVTAFCGPVAFLGIAVPHLARSALGTSDHRLLLPATVLLGAAAALVCSIATQLPGAGSVLPLNAVTSLLGAPVVIGVLLRARRGSTGIAL
jgi:iron complex transport system permease protein